MQLTVDCPWPAVSGGDIRNALVAAAPGVSSLLTVGLTPPLPTTEAEPPPYRHLTCFGDRNPWRCIDPAVPTCLRFPTAALTALDTIVDDFRPDAVVAVGVAWRDVIERLHHRGVPTAVDMHNVESRLFAEQSGARPWWRRLMATGKTARLVSACERADGSISNLAAQTWVCSVADASLLRGIGGRADAVIRNPIPDESLLALPIAADRYHSPTPLFIGHLAYFPNVAAVMELAGPVVAAAARHGIRIRPTVAGRSPRHRIESLSRAGTIRLVADPTSTVEISQLHGYAVLPIRHGGGTRIKAIEALAAGLVLIATRKAVEGLELVHGLHFTAAETPDEMAAALARFVQQPDEAAALAASGRRFAIEHHGRSAVLSAVATALSTVARTG
ncbi:MAG: glycosyltransferase [Planctomycetia bacterium]|nr:glycosyltransferase [Planctomycetia bacterium]